MVKRFRRLIFGSPRDVEDPGVHHKISLIAFLAWVGLGADGLSSSCYGPDEAFRALGGHAYLAVPLALSVALTVFVISYCYTRIVEHFPFGGGGYIVAGRLLGPTVGLVSGSALLVDYVLTISVSIAAGIDALFSFLPYSWQGLKLGMECSIIVAMMLMNLRGIKESVTALMPIFLLFLATHAVIILGIPFVMTGSFGAAAEGARQGFSGGLASLGAAGLFGLFLRSYSLGAGTYTGIEAVSNGLPIMREPKVETGKRTMIYMALSLALTAGGILLGYLLLNAHPVPGRTMNAVLIDNFVKGSWLSGGNAGRWFKIVTLLSETALLIVGAQTGFIDGPRVMANMAHDSWLPNRFGTLSDRLTIQSGVFLISAVALGTLLYTRGETSTLVLMYSINVFITFSLSQLAMMRFWFGSRRRDPSWVWNLFVHGVGFVLCFSILGVSLYAKFFQGGWLTLLLTALLVGGCLLIKRHYLLVKKNLSRLDEIMTGLPRMEEAPGKPLDAKAPTAILLVGSYGGLGIHSILAIQKLFPYYFKNFIFVSVGVVDAASFKGIARVEEIRRTTEKSLKEYAALARSLGLAADWRMEMGTDVLEQAERLCLETARDYPRSIIFAGRLIFEDEKWFHRLLHNETAYQIQRRLQFAGLNAMVLPVRVLAGSPA